MFHYCLQVGVRVFFGTDFTDYTDFFVKGYNSIGVRLSLLSLLGLGMTNFSLFFWHGFFSFGGTQLRPFGYMPRHLKRGKLLERISLLLFGGIDTCQGPKSQLPKRHQFFRRYVGYSGRFFQGFSVSFEKQNHIKNLGGQAFLIVVIEDNGFFLFLARISRISRIFSQTDFSNLFLPCYLSKKSSRIATHRAGTNCVVLSEIAGVLDEPSTFPHSLQSFVDDSRSMVPAD